METATIQTPEFERTQTTDPREAKLKDIVKKRKVNLHKTLEEIQHEFSIREDMAVRPTAIDFLVQDRKIQPVIKDEAYDLTDHSQGQMLTRAGIPAQFAPKLMDLEEIELLSTTSDPRRDQIIRYLDLAAYHYLNHPDGVKEFYFVLIIDTEKPPWILTRYRYNQNLIKRLTNPGLFKSPVDTSRLL
jgi:hypothetical protein